MEFHKTISPNKPSYIAPLDLFIVLKHSLKIIRHRTSPKSSYEEGEFTATLIEMFAY